MTTTRLVLPSYITTGETASSPGLQQMAIPLHWLASVLISAHTETLFCCLIRRQTTESNTRTDQTQRGIYPLPPFQSSFSPHSLCLLAWINCSNCSNRCENLLVSTDTVFHLFFVSTRSSFHPFLHHLIMLTDLNHSGNRHRDALGLPISLWHSVACIALPQADANHFFHWSSGLWTGS